MNQSRHLQSAPCADLDILPARLETEVHWTCSFQHILISIPAGPGSFPGDSSHPIVQDCSGAAGRGQLYISLFYSSQRPLADMVRHSPGTCSYSNIVPVPVAGHGTTPYNPSTATYLPNDSQVAQMTSQEHIKDKMRGQYCTFSFSPKSFTEWSCRAFLSQIFYVQQGWLFSLKASNMLTGRYWWPTFTSTGHKSGHP